MIPMNVPLLKPNVEEITFIFKGKKYNVYKGVFYNYSKLYQSSPEIQRSNEYNADFDVSEDAFSTFIEACGAHSFRITQDNIFDLKYLSDFWGVSDLSNMINKIIQSDETGSTQLNSMLYKIKHNLNTDDEEHMLAANFHKHINDERILEFPIDILKRLIYSPAFRSNTNIDDDQKLDFLRKCLSIHGAAASSIFQDLVSLPTPEEFETLFQNDPNVFKSLQPLTQELARAYYNGLNISKSLNEAIRCIITEIRSKTTEENRSLFDSLDFSKAIEKIEYASSLGDPEADVTLSYFYKFGVGASQDLEKSQELSEKSKEKTQDIKDRLKLDQNLNIKDVEVALEKPTLTIPDSIASSPLDLNKHLGKSRLPSRKSSFEIKENRDQRNRHLNFSPDSPRGRRKRRQNDESEVIPDSSTKKTFTFSQPPIVEPSKDDEKAMKEVEADKDRELNDVKQNLKEEAQQLIENENSIKAVSDQNKADVEDNSELGMFDSSSNTDVNPQDKNMVSKKSIDSFEIDSEPDPNSSSHEGSSLIPQTEEGKESPENAPERYDGKSAENPDDKEKVEKPDDSSELTNESQSIEDMKKIDNSPSKENPPDSQLNDQSKAADGELNKQANDESNKAEGQKEDAKANNDSPIEKTAEKEPAKEAPQQKELQKGQIPTQNSAIFGSRKYKQICKSYDNLSNAGYRLNTPYARSGNSICMGYNANQRNISRGASLSGAEDNQFAGGSSFTSGSGRLSSDVSKSHMPYAIEDTANVDFLTSNPEAAISSMKSKCEKVENAKGGYKFASDDEKRDIAQSAFALGIIYWQGLFDTPHDPEKAIHYYELASELGESCAMFNLGTIYDFDFGFKPYNARSDSTFVVQQDIPKAIVWYQKASDLNNPFAQTNLGTMYYFGNEYLEKNPAKAIELFEKASAQNDSDAQTNLGIIYFFGMDTEVDMERAAALFDAAAKKEDSDAQLMLGIIYEDGLSTKYPKNIRKAVELYRKSADQANSNAQFDLGTCYQQGIGVEKDFEKVIEWYSRAAQNGHVDAMYNLAVIYQTGIKEEDEDFMELDDDDDDFTYMIKKDLKRSLRYYKRAAAFNHPDALFNLGILTLENDVDENESDFEKAADKLKAKSDPETEKVEFQKRKIQRAKDALSYFKRAADAGCPEAQFYLGTLYESGSPSQDDEEEEEENEDSVTAVIQVPKDTELAIEYYTMAANLDHMSAQYNLAVLYTTGDEESGILPNKEKAIELFRLAAEKGDADAEYNLKQLLSENDAENNN